MHQQSNDDLTVPLNGSQASPLTTNKKVVKFCTKKGLALTFFLAALCSTLSYFLTVNFDKIFPSSSTPIIYGYPDGENYDDAKIFITESIPTDYALPGIPGSLRTADALVTLLDNAEEEVCITVMYWNLITSDDPFCDGTGDNFSMEHCDVTLQGREGQRVYDGMTSALARGVKFRFLQDETRAKNGKIPPQLLNLQIEHPTLVKIAMWNAGDWYSGGIMHQKLWVIDAKSFYLGSSNMDWLSLTQVKELGVTVLDSPAFSRDVQDYFELWWAFAEVDSTGLTVSYYDDKFQTEFTVPCWSQRIPLTKGNPERCSVPEALAKWMPKGTESRPFPPSVFNGPSYSQTLNGTTSGTTYISGSPPEITGETNLAGYTPTAGEELRCWDEDSLVHTIKDAEEEIFLSVMDFIPSSMYRSDSVSGATLWWSSLQDAILAKVYSTTDIKVKLLISNWVHSDQRIFHQLQYLIGQASLCTNSHGYVPKAGCGTLEVKIFEVPGWDKAADAPAVRHGEAEALYPPYSRVAHSKYIVTDKRANIGTSNMGFSYFYTTAGASFNTDLPAVVHDIKEGFERDWDSDYATDYDEWMDKLKVGEIEV